jgi:nucleotide-binding universal stress UspA family protein
VTNESDIVESSIRQQVVVGIDGSAQSKLALRWAAHFAASADARLTAVAAWNYPYTWALGAMPIVWDPRLDTNNLINHTVDEVFATGRPAGLTLIVREGNPAKVLLDVSEGALMLVVGSRGHGGFTGLLLGSVSANVAEHATCPVLVIHGDTAPRDHWTHLNDMVDP